MPFGFSNRSTEALLVPNLTQFEDDGSIVLATDTGLMFGQAGLIQANAEIGDGPYGATSGDYDAYKVRVSAGYTLTIDVGQAPPRCEPPPPFATSSRQLILFLCRGYLGTGISSDRANARGSSDARQAAPTVQIPSSEQLFQEGS
jgi:hypothetical protein